MKLFNQLFNILLIIASLMSIVIVYGLTININQVFNIISILTIIFFLDVFLILGIVAKDLIKTN